MSPGSRIRERARTADRAVDSQKLGAAPLSWGGVDRRPAITGGAQPGRAGPSRAGDAATGPLGTVTTAQDHTQVAQKEPPRTSCPVGPSQSHLETSA